MRRISKSILTILSLPVLLYSISMYSLPAEVTGEASSIEATQEAEHQTVQLQAFDALIPSFLGMAPMVLYFIHEVVLLSEAEYQEQPVKVDYENRFLEILFPLIIGPNAP